MGVVEIILYLSLTKETFRVHGATCSCIVELSRIFPKLRFIGGFPLYEHLSSKAAQRPVLRVSEVQKTGTRSARPKPIILYLPKE